MASSTSPFTYEAVEVIFGSIYFYFHIQTAPNLQDCPHSDNLTTFPDFTLLLTVLHHGREFRRVVWALVDAARQEPDAGQEVPRGAGAPLHSLPGM